MSNESRTGPILNSENPSPSQIGGRFVTTLFEHIKNPEPISVRDWTWEEFVQFVERNGHVRCAEKDDQALFGNYELKPGTRSSNANIANVYGWALDLDALSQTAADDVLERLVAEDLAFLCYSTHSHAPAKPKLRVMGPLSRPVPGKDWRPVWRAIVDRYSPGADEACKDARRLYYFPSAKPGAAVELFTNPGRALDVDSLELPRVAPRTAPDLDAKEIVDGGFRLERCPGTSSTFEHGETICRTAPAAVSGSGGHVALLRVARALVWGLELDASQATDLIGELYSPRCDPPWSEAEIAHKVSDAAAPEGAPYVRGALKPAEPGSHPDESRDNENDYVITRIARPEVGLFQRSGKLVIVTREACEVGGVVRPMGAPTIRDVSQTRLREIIRAAVDHESASRAGEILARGEWDHVRPLDAIVSYPIMRRDGTLLLRDGYDNVTRTIVELTGSTRVEVPGAPTRADARAAVQALGDLVSDFPFVGDAHRSSFFAALLTPLARPAIDGPTPMLLLDASQRGSGKTLLADVLSVIVTGAEAPRRTAPETQEEWRKVIFAMLLAGDPVVLIDNVTRMLSSAALDAILTGTTYQDRVLGVSEERRIAIRTTLIASSNNARLSTDLVRRTLLCRLAPNTERPELRSGFAIPDLLGHVRRERARYLTAALVILRAYAAAERPPVKTRTMGSYLAWTAVVRDALVWAGAADPAETQAELRETADVEGDELCELLAAWEGQLGDRSVTAGELAQLANGPLREALRGIMPGGAEPTSHTIGNRLRTLRDQISQGRALRGRKERNTNVWQVVRIAA